MRDRRIVRSAMVELDVGIPAIVVVPTPVDRPDATLPRLPAGKVYKRLLRDRYWGDMTSRIV